MFLSVRLSNYCMFVFISLSVCPSVYLHMFVSVSLSVYLSVCVCVVVCLSVRLQELVRYPGQLVCPFMFICAFVSLFLSKLDLNKTINCQ